MPKIEEHVKSIREAERGKAQNLEIILVSTNVNHCNIADSAVHVQLRFNFFWYYISFLPATANSVKSILYASGRFMRMEKQLYTQN